MLALFKLKDNMTTTYTICLCSILYKNLISNKTSKLDNI